MEQNTPDKLGTRRVQGGAFTDRHTEQYKAQLNCTSLRWKAAGCSETLVLI
jgi:hypothetical protein